ncbi:N-acetyl-gamma-glutamyl-phosphate reductase [Streptosporangium vulgare]|uniref:N-acetyl-gamma-glutamyl-phosphate reductase n=1 Tax=Streptosporangium vulgare TaxID=46190 RepID=UPI0031D0B4A9
MTRVAVVGAAGYIGGELLRILTTHPEVELAAATSRRLRGRQIDGVHPNLRGRTRLAFCAEDRLDHYDVLFLATPHRETMRRMPEFLGRADTIIDLSGDFRLRCADTYEDYYGVPHEATALLGTFVPGVPEFHRERLRTADRVSVPGCMANAGILALTPLAEAGLIRDEITVDARTGSSGAGATAGSENLHAERSGALRVFAPTRHRHEAEISQATGLPVRMTATGGGGRTRGAAAVQGTPRRRRRRAGTSARPTGSGTPTSRSSAWSPSGAACTGSRTRRSCPVPTSATSASPWTRSRTA